MSEKQTKACRVGFDRGVRMEFHEGKMTRDVGLGALVAVVALLAGATAQAYTIQIQDGVVGKTLHYVGACSALSFYESDLQDLGINAYRFWTNSMQLLEWWDDDGAIGSPSPAAIRADQPNGFVNTIPWGFWDATFKRNDTWRRGVQNFDDMFRIARRNDIEPIVVLRAWERPPGSGPWPISSPITQEDLNEWWEHSFAIAYWLNVRNDYQVKYFEVLNEPDLPSQGWDGTQAEYVQLVQAAADAIAYANGLAGVPHYVMAPVVSNAASSYVARTFDDADASVDAGDYHTYDNDLGAFRGKALIMKSNIAMHNPDGRIEPLWLSEFGVYGNYSAGNPPYDTYERAMLTARQLKVLSEEGVEGATVFSMYDWGLDDYYRGMINIHLDGGSETVYTHTYFAYRLMARALVGGRDMLQVDTDFGGDLMAIRGEDGLLYMLVFEGGGTFRVDVSALGCSEGQVRLYRYDGVSAWDDLVGEFRFSGGRFTIDAPAMGIILAEVEVVPEPLTVAFAMSGATALLVCRRKRQRS